MWWCVIFQHPTLTISHDLMPLQFVSGVVDINVAVINPYVGGLGDMMTMAEPSISMAMQDIENSNYLPGYRLNAYLVVPRSEATQINSEVHHHHHHHHNHHHNHHHHHHHHHTSQPHDWQSSHFALCWCLLAELPFAGVSFNFVSGL